MRMTSRIQSTIRIMTPRDGYSLIIAASVCHTQSPVLVLIAPPPFVIFGQYESSDIPNLTTV
jgi:hypothetical protein